MSDHEACIDALSKCPAQDNEGYVPDRGSFKAGWFMALAWERSRVADTLPAEIAEQCRLNAMGQEREFKLMTEVDRLKTENQYLRTIAKIGLSFAPKGPVPAGLAPMFYHTLSYEADAKLQAVIDEARRYLADE